MVEVNGKRKKFLESRDGQQYRWTHRHRKDDGKGSKEAMLLERLLDSGGPWNASPSDNTV